MPAPLFVRALAAEERAALQAGRRAPEAFTLRRSQVVRARAEGHTPRQSARHLGCGGQAVRNVLRAFAREGLGWLRQKSSRPKTTKPPLDDTTAEELRDPLPPPPRALGKARSTWPLV